MDRNLSPEKLFLVKLAPNIPLRSSSKNQSAFVHSWFLLSMSQESPFPDWPTGLLLFCLFKWLLKGSDTSGLCRLKVKLWKKSKPGRKHEREESSCFFLQSDNKGLVPIFWNGVLTCWGMNEPKVIKSLCETNKPAWARLNLNFKIFMVVCTNVILETFTSLSVFALHGYFNRKTTIFLLEVSQDVQEVLQLAVKQPCNSMQISAKLTAV